MTSSSSPPALDAYLSAFAYLCTVVATLRAGSRLCYMAAHGGRIGLIDGPRILGPSDVDVMADVGAAVVSEDGVVGVDLDGEGEGDGGRILEESSKSSLTEEISPLWEVAYAFEQAVKFSLDGGDSGDDLLTSGFHDTPLSSSSSSSLQKSKSPGGREREREREGGGGEVVVATAAVPVPYLMSPVGVIVRTDDDRRRNRGLLGDAAADDDDEEEDEDGGDQSSESEDADDAEQEEDEYGADVVDHGAGVNTPRASDGGRGASTIPPTAKGCDAAAASSADEGGGGGRGGVVARTLAASLHYPGRFGHLMWSAVPSASSVGSAANAVLVRPLRRFERGASGAAWGAYSSLASSWRRGQGRLWWPSSSSKSSLRSDTAGSKSKTIVLPPIMPPVPSTEGRDDDEEEGGGGHHHLLERRRRVARITAYAPRTFGELRSRCFGVDDVEFARAMRGPFVSFQSNSKGAARAGGYFFFSRDGAYMIKSIKRTEARTFLKMLPRYYRHMRRNSRRSLLTRICGMYEVRLLDAVVDVDNDGAGTGGRLPRVAEAGGMFGGKREDHILMVMNSVFPAEASHFISERFDLKGSTVGRVCSPDERMARGSGAVLKDLDLAREQATLSKARDDDCDPRRRLANSSPSIRGIQIGAIAKAALLAQLRKDLRLLVQCGVMDYSLLVGVVNMEGSLMRHIGRPARSLSSRFGSVVARRRESMAGELGRHHPTNGVGDGVRRYIVSGASFSLRTIVAPTVFLINKLVEAVEKTFATVLTVPLPYYGAGICGVDGGALSVLHGRRAGRRAVYYLGVIDFLQPWTARKVLERELKGMVGYDKAAISCVAPKEYAERFLAFLDSNIT